MGFKCGIVGLPNVGKSTLFNALTKTAAAEAANYPFCTIEPNVGIVAVPDNRLDKISKIANSANTIHTQLEFADIAGLVKSASEGAGLGNKFLSHIREVDAIIHVLRCFDDGSVVHVDGQINPLRDIETIETELILADLESLEKRIDGLNKKAKGGDSDAQETLSLVKSAIKILEQGKFVSSSDLEPHVWKPLNLLTSKPSLYVCNVCETEVVEGNQYTSQVYSHASTHGRNALIVSAAIEAEISTLEDLSEREEFLHAIDLQETGLDRIIRQGYELLGLKTYFTAGPKEAKAWTVNKAALAPEAAGAIHSDFARGFICVEVISFQDFIEYSGEQGAKDAGKLRQEGRNYLVQDGDIIHFRFNV